MTEFLKIIWILLQVLIGYNLVLPLILLLVWVITRKRSREDQVAGSVGLDYAIIVTAYQQTSMLPGVIKSILALDYSSFHVYVVADNCHDVVLSFDDPKVTVLKPETVLASNTKSHLYAVDRFIRPHDIITIIDSDNLVHPDYLRHLTNDFNKGYQAVQGVRAPKNLNTTIASLDAARDLYYHFYDGKVLFEIGSSATLAGSGMAFRCATYASFLRQVVINGAGFDKVLQAWLVSRNLRIAFNEHAIVYDEKTSKTDQLVQQRSRWINSWFKYAGLGFEILKIGITKLNKHQVLFGIVLLRPPLFIFLALGILFLFINLFGGEYIAVILWLAGLVIFVITFYVSLLISKADDRIRSSLKNIPKFMYFQFVSLLKARGANRMSISTKHDRDDASF